MNKPLKTPADLHKAVQALGILPFFEISRLPGFSVMALADPDLDIATSRDDPWFWKGKVIGMGHVAYGKFLQDKAIFMRLDLYADFLNYRRASMPVSTAPVAALGGLSDAALLAIIEQQGSLVSSELKAILGFSPRRKRKADDLVDLLQLDTPIADKAARAAARSALDAALSRLQMAGRVCIENFEYNVTRTGRDYGWGLARYTTPEALYGTTALDCDGRTPVQSRQRLYQTLRDANPTAQPARLHTLLA